MLQVAQALLGLLVAMGSLAVLLMWLLHALGMQRWMRWGGRKGPLLSRYGAISAAAAYLSFMSMLFFGIAGWANAVDWLAVPTVLTFANLVFAIFVDHANHKPR